MRTEKDNWSLERKYFPSLAVGPYECNDPVQRLAKMFFLCANVSLYSVSRLWININVDGRLSNHFCDASGVSGLWIEDIGPIKLREFHDRLGDKVALFFQKSDWAYSGTSLDRILDYFRELENSGHEIYVVSEDWSVCLVFTHDEEVVTIDLLEGPPTPRSSIRDPNDGRT
jgi:hypothetical protein